MAQTTPERLSRLLGLVPYLTANPGAELSDVAATFGCTREELIDDLELLFVSGRPGHMPDDLIEASWEDDRIYVSNAEEVSVPVRLSRAEAGTLTLALETILALDPADAEAVASAKDKLAAAASPEETAQRFDIVLPPVDPHVKQVVETALADGDDLQLTYYVPSRDELTERIVDPLTLRLSGRWYLEAHCHTAGGLRSFALDNIRRIQPVPARPHAGTSGKETTANAAGAAAGTVPEPGERRRDRRAPASGAVTMTLTAAGARLVEDMQAETSYDTHGPGTVTITLPVYDQAWLVRWLLAHGKHVIALDPADAVHEALRQSEAALAEIRSAPQSAAG